MTINYIKQGWKKIIIFNKKSKKIRFFFDLNQIFFIQIGFFLIF